MKASRNYRKPLLRIHCVEYCVSNRRVLGYNGSCILPTICSYGFYVSLAMWFSIIECDDIVKTSYLIMYHKLVTRYMPLSLLVPISLSGRKYVGVQ